MEKLESKSIKITLIDMKKLDQAKKLIFEHSLDIDREIEPTSKFRRDKLSTVTDFIATSVTKDFEKEARKTVTHLEKAYTLIEETKGTLPRLQNFAKAIAVVDLRIIKKAGDPILKNLNKEERISIRHITIINRSLDLILSNIRAAINMIPRMAEAKRKSQLPHIYRRYHAYTAYILQAINHMIKRLYQLERLEVLELSQLHTEIRGKLSSKRYTALKQEKGWI